MSARRSIFKWTVALCYAPMFDCVVAAASPALTSVLPRGGQRGSEIEVTLGGDRLVDAQELFLYQPGLTVKKLVATTQAVKASVAIAPDAPLGEHKLRVRTASGVTELHTFWVGALPSLDEKEPNTDFATPQKIDLNVTALGKIENEDVDYFAVELKKGQRLNVEMEAIRLGDTMFDAYVAILDTKRFELAACDDSALLLQDPVVSLIAPADGTYIIQVRDSAYGGGGDSHYRLHVGTFPRPRAVHPAGGQVGEDLKVEFIGDVGGPIAKTIKLPAEPSEHRALVEQDGQIAPSPNLMRVSAFANFIENVSPNTPSDPPIAFNGIIKEPNDQDRFMIRAKKDQPLDVQVYARRLRSPLDPVLTILDGSGNGIASNDDTNGPDSYLRFVPPADGQYTLAVNDRLLAGGPEFVYRIEVTPAKPAVALTVPLVANNSQERQTVVIPRGNRFATEIRATRADCGGDVTLGIANLPKGVTMHAEPVPVGQDTVPVVFEAAADAPIAGALCDVSAKVADADAKSTFSQTADLIVFGNQVVYYQAKFDKLAVAVAEEAPFKLSIVQPKVPLVQGGSMQLKVVAERKEGFKAPIALALKHNPPGISAGTVSIPEGGTEAIIPLNASGDAAVRKSKITVIGSAEVNGPLWVSTPLTEIEVAPPFVGGTIEMATAEKGKPAQVLCNLAQKVAFEGKAKIQLLGLPPNTTAAEREITPADASVTFDLVTTDTSPVGTHKTMFCVVTVTKSDEPIVHTIAGGGVLRIDAPPPAEKPVAVAAAPTTAPAKPVSRLQKLRDEQAARVAEMKR